MKILILGATGQIGGMLYESLKANHTVIGTTRKSSTTLVQFDPFADEWSILRNIDVIVNCIGQIDSTRACSFSKIHVQLAERLIANRRVLGNPRIIQISALGATPNHGVEFLRTKGQADDYLMQFDNVVIVRPSIVCTSGTMMVRKMRMLHSLSRRMLGVILIPKGFPATRIQPVMPKDFAAIVENLCTASRPPTLINITGPERISFADIMSTMFLSRGSKHTLLQIPKAWTDVLVKYCVVRLFPKLITLQQYELLFIDNVADHAMAEQHLARPLTSTKEFWKQQLSTNASH